ncbi:MAG TPA: DUF6056 family protein [Kofleriaceae bacterium]|nr:DUF6056 family protein [Kofleriaceae bacterium]
MVSRALRALFVAYVAATAVHIGLVMAHEPFAFDAWNLAVDTHAQPFSLRRFLGYGIFEYQHSNPRIGQWLTYLSYKLTWFAPVATPIAYLALSFATATLGLGRWPGGRTGAGGERTVGRDLALVAIAIGTAWFALPRIGMIMFCRAYGANYLYGAAIQLWFLVPLRLAGARGAGPASSAPVSQPSVRAQAAYFAFGVLAGMCNEHTGPTLIVFLVGYAVWRQRTSGQRPRLVWAGTLGAIAGFAAIFFAPGQDSRYEGLATKVSFVGRLLQRGATGNLDIFHDWVLACAPVLGLTVIALVCAGRDGARSGGAARDRDPLQLLGLALAAGTLITATVFVSPKLGPRFYLHGSALVLAGFIAVADRTLTTTRRLAPFVAVAVAASAYAGYRSLPLYLRLHDESVARIAGLEAAPRGSVYTAEAFEQVDDSWWFLGDDFRDVRKREMVARYFGLDGVVFRAVDIDAPLGVSDVRLIPRYEITPASCLDGYAGVDMSGYRGIDLTAVQKAAAAEIERLRGKLAAVGRLDRLDLVVGFAGATPPLPRPTLVVARWRPSGLEVHAGAIERQGSSKVRRVKLPTELVGGDYEIYAYQVSGEARRLGTARDAALDYVPWKHGAYWALACHPTECFVIAVARVL